MAEHKLAILVSAVGAAKAAKDLKGVDAAISNIGARAGRGLRTAGANMLKLGAAGAAVGAGLVAVNVKAGVQSLATLESAVTSVQGALVNMGYAGQVTGAQVATWANEIEADTQAAFDDKAITASAANLIRYGRIGPTLLRPAMVVMTDLAAKTGDVETASKALAKAMADPTKATRILKDAGVVLTKAQQKQINTWMEQGKRGKAQAYLLDLIAQNTKGAAAAMNGPWQDAMNTMGDATEDAQRALAIGFMPVIQRAAEWIKGVLADPGTIAQIETFGRSMAGAFDEAITFAQSIPWDAVGNGLRTAADWAKKLFDAFRSLPPEAQATIIALGGLDKLSGGAISGIAGELGKGLIKGVLGMTAGVVNIKAGVVNGGGGGPGGKGIGGKVLTGAGAAGAAGAALGIGAGVAAGGAVAGAMFYGGPALIRALYGPGKGNEQTPIAGSGIGAGPLAGQIRMWTPALRQTEANTAEQARRQQESITAFRAGERTSATGLATVASTTSTGAAMTAMAQAMAAARIVSAINAARAVVNVSVNIPGANVRYGSHTGSAGHGAGHNGPTPD